MCGLVLYGCLLINALTLNYFASESDICRCRAITNLRYDCLAAVLRGILPYCHIVLYIPLLFMQLISLILFCFVFTVTLVDVLFW